ncbi:11150_t:CDS:10 [Gigaspora margarita]|uniref:11150_t:CDS:1 n=1 Tax=Gigaspora margarita TaxID=4874 RepID=A0ABN7VG69_GIGMA|nr:11150_t:CDS:10 [Gigaspora margarita]
MYDNENFEMFQDNGYDSEMFKSLFEKYKSSNNQSISWLLGFCDNANIQYIQSLVLQQYLNLFEIDKKLTNVLHKKTLLKNNLDRLSLTLKDKIKNHDQKILNNIILNSNRKHLSPQETQALMPCINCKNAKLSTRSWCLNAFGVRYSYAVAAAGLDSGISYHATQSVLAILGVISQSCKKSYYMYQNKMFNNLVLYAKESALKALTKCLDYIEINHKEKILPISFDCSWAHGQNAKQASGEFLCQIKTDEYFHNPIIAFHTVQKTRTVENNKTKYFNRYVFASLRKEDPSKLTPTEEELRELQIEGLIRHLCNDHKDSSITLNEPTLENFTITTYRTSGNESFNRVKLAYLDKKIDYWSSYCARHALAILYNNKGYLYVLSSLRELYGTVPFSNEDIKNIGQFKLEPIHERNQNHARQYELEKNELIGFDFSQELILYKFKGKEQLKFNTFYPLFAPLIPDFEAIVWCHGLNKYFLNSYEEQSEILYLTLEQKIEIVTKKIFDFIIRDEQKQAILNYVQHKKDTFIVIKTDGGKTLCYVIPAILFEGLIVIISPLTALIQNQVVRLYASSVGTLGHEEKIFQEIAMGFTKILFVILEKLMLNKSFQRFLTNLYQDRRVQFAIDEAFIMMLTPTCTFKKIILIRESLHIRENDFIYIYASNQVRKGRAIIYCTHKEECHKVLKELQKKLEDENIDEFFVLEKWNREITRIIIATTAFANLIQQSERAGRDGLPAKIVVFFTLSDLRTNYCIITKNKESITEKNDPKAHTYQQYLQQEQKKLFEMENAKIVNASTEVLEMLDIVETLTTQFKHQIIPEDIIAVFNHANTIRVRDKGYGQLEYYNKKNKKSKLNTQFMAQIILDNLVVKGLVWQELLLQKLRTNISYLTLSIRIVDLEEEAKSRAVLQEWPYWVQG